MGCCKPNRYHWSIHRRSISYREGYLLQMQSIDLYKEAKSLQEQICSLQYFWARISRNPFVFKNSSLCGCWHEVARCWLRIHLSAPPLMKTNSLAFSFDKSNNFYLSPREPSESGLQRGLWPEHYDIWNSYYWIDICVCSLWLLSLLLLLHLLAAGTLTSCWAALSNDATSISRRAAQFIASRAWPHRRHALCSYSHAG